MKKIIVFGASGDTGKYFVDYLCGHLPASGYEIVACGTRETDFFDRYAVHYIRLDITKPEQFGALPKDPYAVVDLAGLMPARMKGYDPRRHIDVNIIGTLNILEYCRLQGADRILFAQSFGDIKDHAERDIVLHSHMERSFSFKSDHTVYVMCKNFSVDLIEHYHQMYGLKRFIFRLPTIYLWSRNDQYYVDGVARKIGYRVIIDHAIKGEPIDMWGDKSRKKDMVYVKDFCQMLCRALTVDLERGYYNVGTGIGTSLEEQIRGIAEVFGPEGEKSEIRERPDLPNAPQYIMDITSAVNDLGYCPKYDYLSMLRDMKDEMEKDRF